jgi:hypothetical protein
MASNAIDPTTTKDMYYSLDMGCEAIVNKGFKKIRQVALLQPALFKMFFD